MVQRNINAMDHVAISVAGKTLSRELTGDLVDVMVDTTLHMPAMFIMRFHDDRHEWVDRGPFELGAVVKIELSHGEGTLERVITGEITAIEPTFTEDLTAILTIRGYDRSHRLNRGTKSKVFLQVSDSDIASQIAQEAGLQATVDSTNVVYEHIFQHNQTDLAFLQERARKIGYEVYVDDTKLNFRKHKSARGSLLLDWGINLQRFQPRLTLSSQVDEVIVRGWEPANKKEIIGKAVRSKSAPEIGMRGQGGELASRAFSSAKQVIVRQPVASQREADLLAQAVLDEINAAFVEAEGLARGNPKLVAGTELEIHNVGERFSGKYTVTSSVHNYTPEGYEVYFRVEGTRPKLIADLLADQAMGDTQSNPWGGVFPAVVTNNNDPKGMSRVKLKFPWIDTALETDWARVASVGAGNDRGLFWLPEVNDEVLVAFEHGDFRHPYVIGGLWNGKDKPPENTASAVKNGKVEIRTFKSREGHIIRLVDDSSGQHIEITDAKGKHNIKLDTTANKLTITTEGNLEVKSQGTTNIEAAGNLSIKGTANVSIEAGAQLNLKGSMVNIN